MKYLITGAVIGVIVLAIVLIYLINSGVLSAKKERDDAVAQRDKLQDTLNEAEAALIQIAAGLTGNPQAEAAAALGTIRSRVKQYKELNR